MKKIPIGEFSKRPDHFLNNLLADKLILESLQGQFVILPLSEYNSIIETLYLNSTPANTQRLLDSINELSSISSSPKPKRKNSKK